MKKFKYIFCFFCSMLFLCCNAYAEGEVVIKSIEPIYDVNSSIDVTYEDNFFNSIVFNDKNQSVKYKVVIKNVSDMNLKVSDILLTKPTENYVLYNISGIEKKTGIKSDEEKEFYVTLETIVTESWGREFKEPFDARIKFVEDIGLPPNTGYHVSIVFLGVTFIGSLVLFVVFRNKKIVLSLLVVGGFSFILPNAKALVEVDLNIFSLAVKYESQNIMKKAYTLDADNDIVYGDYWEYNSKIKNFYIENELNEKADYVHKFDVSEKQNGKVIAYLVTNEEDNTYFDVYLQADGIIYPNSNASYYFSHMSVLESINNLIGLDTRHVTDMSCMFSFVGIKSDNLILDLSSFNTSNVTNMYGMFSQAGYLSTNFILDISSFDTSNVTDMELMFYNTGRFNSNFILDVSNFDTSNVKNMSAMFAYSGYNNPNFTLDVSNFDTSKVIDMSHMFADVGYNNPNFTLDVSNFDTSKVIDMSYMFAYLGYNNPNFTLDVSNFDTSNVINMSYMFESVGYNSPNFTLDVSNFDTSKVIDMSYMFARTGRNGQNFFLNLGNFDTSKVTDMSNMFYYMGQNSNNLNFSITIRNRDVENYEKIFYGTVSKSGTQITVNYTSETEALVDQMIATKSENSNVVKGTLVE